MKTILIYQSKTGCTEDCALFIQSKVDNIDVVNLKKAKIVNIEAYDRVIIGSSIYVGGPLKYIRKYCAGNEQKLLNKDLFLYFLGASKNYEEVEKGLKKTIPQKLIEHAKAISFFGGEIRFDKLNFFERVIMKKIKKENNLSPTINYKAIDEFIKMIEK